SMKSLNVNSNKLRYTHITPHFNTDIDINTNLIYCATFQIAWNSLQDNFFKEPLLLTGNPWDAEQLNKQEVTSNDIDSNSYVAIADTFNKELIERINEELQQKFGDNAPRMVYESQNVSELAILSYCYLYKNLVFNKKFNKNNDPLSFYDSGKYLFIPSFGVDNSGLHNNQAELAKQVDVLYYTNDDDFALSLKSISVNDELILAKTKPTKNLASTITLINGKIDQSNITPMKDREILMIPYIDYDVEHSFKQFLNKLFLNDGWTGCYIDEAKQKIRFNLNESGALLKSEAIIDIKSGTHTISKKYREFVFNKPFLIMLRKKGSNLPYFAMWVGNTELLGKY
ncbi:MAG: hypothetical protein Q7U87_02320, partial [bacterium]|nr:hypothetical protein [bacterium]